MSMRFILAGALLLGYPAFASAADVNCRTNAMTDYRFCSVRQDASNSHSRVYMTGDDKTGLSLVSSAGGLSSRWHVDTILVRIDGGQPIRLKAEHVNSDVDCSGVICYWSALAFAKPTAAQWQQMAAAKTLLVANGEGSAASDPVDVPPSLVQEWLDAMATVGMKP